MAWSRARLPLQPRSRKFKLEQAANINNKNTTTISNRRQHPNNQILARYRVFNNTESYHKIQITIELAAMANEAALNPLISTQKSSDTSLQIALHPLVLLTISDYITRHTLRQQKGPIVGALLGQQNGREITIEHAFDCLLAEADNEIVLNQAWFEERLQQSQ